MPRIVERVEMLVAEIRKIRVQPVLNSLSHDARTVAYLGRKFQIFVTFLFSNLDANHLPPKSH